MEVRNMNGLKFIRTRCNYSQAALAEQLNVSRQAINMWESSKKSLSEKRKKELMLFFGLENSDWFCEIDNETVKKIQALPLYRVVGEASEHFHFSPHNEPMKIHFSADEEVIISLDDKCTLKRAELKKTLEAIQEYSENRGVKNSYGRMHRINIIQRILIGIFDAIKCTDTKKPNKKMMYIYTLFAIIDAINISYGNISIEDLPESNRSKASSDLYDYTEFTKSLSKNISEHIDFYSKKIEERSNR